jgi:hypothetical protein
LTIFNGSFRLCLFWYTRGITDFYDLNLNRVVIPYFAGHLRFKSEIHHPHKNTNSQQTITSLNKRCRYKPFHTMTVIKATSDPNMYKSSAKVMPKKAVSFSKACKFSFPPEAVCMQNDSFLQCTDKRRKYMRRGSKSPAMLQNSSDQVESFDEEVSAEKTNTEFASNGGRRLSLMSALKINFEKSTITEPTVASKIRRLSIDQQRRYPHDLISKA